MKDKILAYPSDNFYPTAIIADSVHPAEFSRRVKVDSKTKQQRKHETLKNAFRGAILEGEKNEFLHYSRNPAAIKVNNQVDHQSDNSQ